MTNAPAAMIFSELGSRDRRRDRAARDGADAGEEEHRPELAQREVGGVRHLPDERPRSPERAEDEPGDERPAGDAEREVIAAREGDA